MSDDIEKIAKEYLSEWCTALDLPSKKIDSLIAEMEEALYKKFLDEADKNIKTLLKTIIMDVHPEIEVIEDAIFLGLGECQSGADFRPPEPLYLLFESYIKNTIANKAELEDFTDQIRSIANKLDKIEIE